MHTTISENYNQTYISIYTYDIYTTHLHTRVIYVYLYTRLLMQILCRMYRYLRLLNIILIIHMCLKEDCHHAYVSIYTYDIYTTRLHMTYIRLPLHTSLKENSMSYV